jgi:AcrR family transcriptional regulator
MARLRDQKKAGLIIASATEVFGELGFQAARITQVAARAGISSGTIYTYFRDKEALFTAAVKAGWEGFLTRIRDLACSPLPPEDRLEGFVELGFHTLKSALPLLRGMLFESRQSAILHRSLERLCGYIEQLLNGGGAGSRGERETDGPGHPPAGDPEARRAFIRITVLGVLFSAALAEPSRTDAEIRRLKKAVRLLLSERPARTRADGRRFA